jgi:ubiquinone/menaquinone biosynthesis C-methylase UbiE
MDVCSIDNNKLPVAKFDVIIDKGTIDSLFCSDTAENSVKQALQEISKVLKNGSNFICISFGAPRYFNHFVSLHFNCM